MLRGLLAVTLLALGLTALPADAAPRPETASSAQALPPEAVPPAESAAPALPRVEAAPPSRPVAGAPATGHATLTFTVPEQGAYRLHARVIAATDGDDSFWVRSDGGAWTQRNGIPLGTSWHWAEVPVAYTLSPGTHTIAFAYREDGARLDRVALTSDPAFTPEAG
ncbi:hypothetical protein ACWENQ_02880 [Nonomuraea sp. NPDC004354]